MTGLAFAGKSFLLEDEEQKHSRRCSCYRCRFHARAPSPTTDFPTRALTLLAVFLYLFDPLTASCRLVRFEDASPFSRKPYSSLRYLRLLGKLCFRKEKEKSYLLSSSSSFSIQGRTFLYIFPYLSIRVFLRVRHFFFPRFIHSNSSS